MSHHIKEISRFLVSPISQLDCITNFILVSIFPKRSLWDYPQLLDILSTKISSLTLLNHITAITTAPVNNKFTGVTSILSSFVIDNRHSSWPSLYFISEKGTSVAICSGISSNWFLLVQVVSHQGKQISTYFLQISKDSTVTFHAPFNKNKQNYH